MTLMWLRVVVLLCAAEVSAGASYSLLDPDADHTKMAIEFDKAGKDSQAVQSFTAAVKFVPTFRNRHNLGVAFMRLGHKESRNVRMTGFALYGGCLVRGIHWAGLSLAWLQVEAATKFYSLAHKQFTVALELPGASSGERAATESLLTKMSTYFQSQFGRPFTPDPQAVNEFEVDVRASREDPHASAVQVSADGSTRSSSLPASLRLPKHADGSPLFWRGSQDDIARQDAIVTELHGSSAETTTAHGDTGDRQNRRLPRRRASQSTVAFQRYNPKDAIEVRACSTIFATLSWRSWLHSFSICLLRRDVFGARTTQALSGVPPQDRHGGAERKVPQHQEDSRCILRNGPCMRQMQLHSPSLFHSCTPATSAKSGSVSSIAY